MLSTKDLVYVALFAAVVAVLGLVPKIQLISGVPVTAQSMGVMLAGGVLGSRRGGLALLVFIILVLAGLPLLAGGRGGLGLLAGASGGFILGFPVAAFATGLLVEKWWGRLSFATALLCSIVGGIIVLYLIGIPWMAIAAGFGGKKAFLLMLPFLPGDIIKAVLAAVVIVAVKKAYPLIQQK